MASSLRLKVSEWWSKIDEGLVGDVGSGGHLNSPPPRGELCFSALSLRSHLTTFNHVGLCVSDRERSRRFYENVLGFQFCWELDPPDGPTAKLVQLPEPLGVHATYLVRDGFVLELMDYSKRQVHTGPERVMDQIGLTHIELDPDSWTGG